VEITPLEKGPDSALVQIDSVAEEVMLIRATRGNSSNLLPHFGAKVSLDLYDQLLQVENYPKEIELKRWQLAYVAHGLARTALASVSPSTLILRADMMDVIHSSGFGKHWSTRFIAKRA
jgi:hypothetical protein